MASFADFGATFIPFIAPRPRRTISPPSDATEFPSCRLVMARPKPSHLKRRRQSQSQLQATVFRPRIVQPRMCGGTFDAAFSQRRLKVSSYHCVMRRSVSFRQIYNSHGDSLDRSYSCRDRLLLLPCKLVHRCPLPRWARDVR
jgi:hypothetical protein